MILMDFLDKGESLVLVIYVNQQGQLTPVNDFPATSKNKVQSMQATYCTTIPRYYVHTGSILCEAPS